MKMVALFCICSLDQFRQEFSNQNKAINRGHRKTGKKIGINFQGLWAGIQPMLPEQTPST
jgi:hypothetical protein